MPKQSRARSGDLGEILATEYLNEQPGPKVLVKRLRFKDGRELALRGDDIFACSYSPSDGLKLIKGECKSRKSLTMRVLLEAEEKLHEHSGRPSEETANFITSQIKLTHPLMWRALVAYLHTDRGTAAKIEHFIGVFTQQKPARIFPAYLRRRRLKSIPRHVVAMVVTDHQARIKELYRLAGSRIKSKDELADG